MEITGFDNNIEIYPCSCGHCPSCGLQFIPTEGEARRWAEEDGVEGTIKELVAYYSGS